MSIEELFESGERKQDRSHFRNMVLIAKADGVIRPEERALLHKMGQHLGLSDLQMAEIIKHSSQLRTVPPYSREERFEQMIDLVRMVQIDGSVDDAEMKILERVAVGIGYSDLDDVDVESILAMIVRGEDTETILSDLL